MNAVAQTAFSPRRVGAMVLRYWYLLLSSWPRFLELMYWPVLQVITWGFLQNYISQTSGFFARAGGSLIGAVLEAGRHESSLRPESLERLAALDRDLAIDVFVTPT